MARLDLLDVTVKNEITPRINLTKNRTYELVSDRRFLSFLNRLTLIPAARFPTVVPNAMQKGS